MANHIIYNTQNNAIRRDAAAAAVRALADLLGIPGGPPLVLHFNNTQGRDKLVIEAVISRPFAPVLTQRNENFVAGTINQAINVVGNAQNAASINILKVVLSGSQSESFQFTFKLAELRQQANSWTLIANLGLVGGRICLIVLRNPLGNTIWPGAPAAGAMVLAAADAGQTIASGGVKLP